MPPPRTAHQKPKHAKETFQRIFRYLAVHRWKIFLVSFLVILSTGATVAGNYFVKPIIDDHVIPWIGQKNPDFAGLFRLILLVAGIYFVGIVSLYAYNRVMVTVAADTLYLMRKDMFSHMQKLPIRYFDTRTHGEIMSRYTNDIDTLRNMLSHTIPSFISSIVSLIGTVAMMLALSLPLTLLVLLLCVDTFVVTKFITKRSAASYRVQQKALGTVNGYVEELIEGQKVVKVFCHEEHSKKNFDQLNEELCDAATRANTFASILNPILGNLNHMHYAITVLAGVALTILSNQRDLGIFTIGLGTLLAFLQYARSFANPISQISQQFNVILNALAGAERIFALLDEKPEEDDGYVTLVNAKEAEDGTLREVPERTGLWAWKHPHHDGSVTYIPVRGEVTFEEVDFGYNPETMVLKNISLYAKPGQKIALVGSTGAGKTTITNLINRFYDVPDGKIRYDGINITKIKKADLRRSLSMVLQDTHLFTGTVMENIRYGNLSATDEEVIAAAKLANAHWFISHLPQGYDTELTRDGGNLSQGQRQLIAIARAAIADPPVLILDEATSSIDTRTEALIEKGMDELMKGRTVFVIAHRLSTVRNSNVILVLEHGEVIERGSHDELLAQQGKYYQLYTGMFELS